MSVPGSFYPAIPSDKPIAFVTVGLPGSGKSTWASNHPDKLPIASTDEFIEAFAAQKNISYGEAFKAHHRAAAQNMKSRVAGLCASGQNFIWDQVNELPAERVQIHATLSKTHNVVYVCFFTPLDVCLARHDARERDGGKVIDARRIHFLARRMRWPLPGREPFFKIVKIIHPEWPGNN